MNQSEYKMQAYINDGLNQQHAMDSLEGSTALKQPDKTLVDGTDIQKAQILEKNNAKSTVVQSLMPGKPVKTNSRTRSPKNNKHKN